MNQLSGVVGAGPLFAGVVDTLVGQGAVRRIPTSAAMPQGIEEHQICALSGQLPSPHCTHRRTVRVASQHAPDAACSWHRPVRVDRRNGLRASASCPEEFTHERVFAHLPTAYHRWQSENEVETAPSEWSPFCLPDTVAADAVNITHPLAGDIFLVEPGYDRATQSVALQVEVDPPVPDVQWWVDGQLRSTVAWPYQASWNLSHGEHVAIAVAGDRRSDPVSFTVR